MTPIRILHAIHSLDPSAGGPPVVVHQLKRAQEQRGMIVRIVAVVGAEEGSTLASTGIRWLVGLAPEPTTLGTWLATADVVHLHGIWDPLLVVLARAARRKKIPYLITPHGMLDPWSLAQSRWKKRFARATTHKKLLAGAAGLHALNTDEERSLPPLGLKVPTTVIPNGIESDFLASIPPPGTFRRMHSDIGAGPYILFLSRLHHKKGLDILADAFAEVAGRFADVMLVVAGPDEGARKEFEAQIGRLGIANRVRLVGPLYGTEKWAAYRDAACFCLPSRQEGFSIAILEALACACPVVITEGCHFPEVATARAGVIAKLDATAIAEGLAKVLSAPVAAERMGQAGREMVEANYTWDRIAAKFEDFYRDSLGRSPA